MAHGIISSIEPSWPNHIERLLKDQAILKQGTGTYGRGPRGRPGGSPLREDAHGAYPYAAGLGISELIPKISREEKGRASKPCPLTMKSERKKSEKRPSGSPQPSSLITSALQTHPHRASVGGVGGNVEGS